MAKVRKNKADIKIRELHNRKRMGRYTERGEHKLNTLGREG